MPLSGSAFWAVVLPVEKTNIYENPSYERLVTGWTSIVGATSAQDSTTQQFGASSFLLKFTSNNGTAGAYSPAWSSGNGTDYTASVYIRGVNGVPYRIAAGDSSGVNFIGSTTFTGGGTWQRYSFSYTETANTSRTFVITKNASADTGTIWCDGFQVEVGSLTTYLDGDQDGCYWLGVPHSSQSVRSGTYRGGGSVVALEDLGLKPDDHPGIGMPPQEVTSQSFALDAGDQYIRSRSAARPFSLTFKPILGTTLQGFHVVRRTLLNAIKPDLIDPQQPVRFWYTGGQGTVQIDAVYQAGLELGEMNGPIAENGAVRFFAPDPYVYSTTQQGTSLAGRVALGTTNFMAKRDPQGRWGTLGANGSTLQGVPNASFADAAGVVDATYNDGTLFFCGSFGTVAGTVYNDIAMYFNALNTFGTLAGGTLGTVGAASPVRALYYAPWGSLYIGGDFQKAGGTIAKYIAAWNGAFGTLLNGTIEGGALGAGSSVRTLAMSAGTLWLGGRFNGVGGTTGAVTAMYRNGSWGTTGMAGNAVTQFARQLVVGLDRALYVTGGFTSAAGTTVGAVARYKDGAWGSMGTGFQGGAAGVTIASQPNGKIVGAGVFTNTDSGSVNNIAEWNGQSWAGMGSGLVVDGASGNTWITDLFADQSTGDVYASGQFNVADGRRTPDGLARWNGYSWVPLDLDVSGQGTFTKVVIAPDRTLFALGSWQGTGQAAAVAQVMNFGMAPAYPTFKIRATSTNAVRWYQLVNYTTGDGIWMNNYIIQPGEELTLETVPGNRSLVSSAFGNIFGYIVPGSNLATFRLMPGTNWISLFCDSNNIAASIYWNTRSDSIDGGTIF